MDRLYFEHLLAKKTVTDTKYNTGRNKLNEEKHKQKLENGEMPINIIYHVDCLHHGRHLRCSDPHTLKLRNKIRDIHVTGNSSYTLTNERAT